MAKRRAVMIERSARQRNEKFGYLRRIIVILAILPILVLFTNSAYADITECYSSVKRSKQINDKVYTVLVFSGKPRCDLYGAIRLYPQFDPKTEEPLKVQEQLRSLYAANEKVDIAGGRQARTVLRGCVPNSKPWPDQTAEERDFCPGLVNYYQNGFGGPVLIPASRMFTRTEKLEDAFSKACLSLSSKSELSKQDQAILLDCQKLIAGFKFQPSSKKEAIAEQPIIKKDESVTTAYIDQINNLQNRVAQLEPRAQKESWLWPLFVLLMGFAIFGSSVTIFGIKERRARKEMESRHKLFAQEPRAVVTKSESSSTPRIYTEEQFRKIEKRLRNEVEKRYLETIKRYSSDLEKQYEKKYSGIASHLATKVISLETSLNDVSRKEAERIQEFHEVLEKITDERDSEKSKALDAKSESQAFQQELETLQNQFADTDQAYQALLAEFKDIKSELSGLVKRYDDANTEAEQKIQALETRLKNLLATQDPVYDSDSQNNPRAKTLPIGVASTEAFGIGLEDSTYSMVLERGKIRDDQYDEKDQENISSSRFGYIKTESDEGGIARDPMITEMDELCPSEESKNFIAEEKTLTGSYSERDPDNEQESAEKISRTSHESHTACIAEHSSSEEDDEKAQDAS